MVSRYRCKNNKNRCLVSPLYKKIHCSAFASDYFLYPSERISKYLRTMIAFKISHLSFVTIGVCDAPATAKWPTKLLYRMIGLTGILLEMATIISSSVYVIQKGKKDLVDASYGVFQAVGALGIILAVIDAFFRRHKIEEIFSKFHQIHSNFSAFILNSNLLQ